MIILKLFWLLWAEVILIDLYVNLNIEIKFNTYIHSTY